MSFGNAFEVNPSLEVVAAESELTASSYHLLWCTTQCLDIHSFEYPGSIHAQTLSVHTHVLTHVAV